MLPKALKLTSKEILRLKSKKPKYLYVGTYFKIYFYNNLNNKENTKNKFIVIVPKKNVSKAFLRNLIKRQSYFVIMQNIKLFPTGCFIFVFKKSLKNIYRKTLYEKINLDVNIFLSKIS